MLAQVGFWSCALLADLWGGGEPSLFYLSHAPPFVKRAQSVWKRGRQCVKGWLSTEEGCLVVPLMWLCCIVCGCQVGFWWSFEISWRTGLLKELLLWVCCGPFPSSSPLSILLPVLYATPVSRHDWMEVIVILYLMNVFQGHLCFSTHLLSLAYYEMACWR